jgi:hypothetical protein
MREEASSSCQAAANARTSRFSPPQFVEYVFETGNLPPLFPSNYHSISRPCRARVCASAHVGVVACVVCSVRRVRQTSPPPLLFYIQNQSGSWNRKRLRPGRPCLREPARDVPHMRKYRRAARLGCNGARWPTRSSTAVTTGFVRGHRAPVTTNNRRLHRDSHHRCTRMCKRPNLPPVFQVGPVQPPQSSNCELDRPGCGTRPLRRDMSFATFFAWGIVLTAGPTRSPQHSGRSAPALAQRTGGNPLLCMSPCRRAKWGSRSPPTTPRACLCLAWVVVPL